MLEISSTEYLESHSNSQIRRDFMHFLKLAVNPQPQTVSSFYAGLLPESLEVQASPDVMNHKTDTMTMTRGGGSDLTTVFTNMLETLFCMTEASKDAGLREYTATRLFIFHGKSFSEIAQLVNCSESSVRRDIAHVTNWAISRLKRL